MKTNKDTTKAIEAATTLIKYCARYKNCKGCIFYAATCSVGYPCFYKEKGVFNEIHESNFNNSF